MTGTLFQASGGHTPDDRPPAEHPLPAGERSAPCVVGIDLSLTSTGLALADGTTHTIRTGPGDHLADQHNRLRHIVDEIERLTGAGYYLAPSLAVVEGPSYGSSGAGTWDRAGLWWLLIDHLLTRAVPVAVVPPAVLKRYATGRGKATKADMRVALLTRTGIDERDDNRVDAWWLRAAGLDILGHPIVALPAAQSAALDKIRPEVSRGLDT